MNKAQLSCILLWSAALNSALLLWWFGAFALMGDRIYRLHSRWFKLSREQFDALHYAGMAAYKLLIFFFNLAPLAAVWLSS